MAEHAVWRRRQNGPRTPLGMVSGNDRLGGVPIAWSIFGIGAVYVFLGAFAKAWGIGFAQDLVKYVAIGGLTTILLGRQKAHRASLAPDPAPGPCFSVGIKLRRHDNALGYDSGFIAFNDGWLVFEGEATFFSIRPSDVRKSFRMSSVRLLTLKDNLVLELSPYASSDEFQARLQEWAKGENPSGESLLPPIASSPQTGQGFTAALHGLGAWTAGVGVGEWLHAFLFGPSLSSTLFLVAISFTCILTLLICHALRWRRARNAERAKELGPAKVGNVEPNARVRTKVQ